MTASGGDTAKIEALQTGARRGPRPVRSDSESAGPTHSDSRRSWRGSHLHRQWWIGMVIALIVVLAGLVQQFRRAETLEVRVELLGQELSGARAEIAVHEARMASVRSAVDDLAARVGVLQKVVAEPQRAP